MIAVSSLGVIAGSLLAPIEAIFISSLTSSKTLLGLTFSIGSISYLFFSLWSGRKSIVWGRKKFILIGLAAGIFYPIIYATALNVFQYMFGRVAWALAGGISGIMINSLFQDLVAKKKNIAEVIGWRFSAQSIAGTVAVIASGWMADQWSLRIPYLLVIAAYLLALFLFVYFIYGQVEDKRIKNTSAKQSISESLRDLVTNPYLFLRSFLEGITQSHWVMEPIIFPLIILGMTGKNLYTGLIFGLMGVVAMIFFPAIGRLVDKSSPVKALKKAFVIYSFALVILFMAKSIILFTLGALLLSLGKAFNGTASSKIETQNIKSEYRGEYLSYIKAYDLLTAAIAAMIIGVLLNYFTPRIVLLLFAIFTASGGLLGFGLFNLKMIRKSYKG